MNNYKCRFCNKPFREYAKLNYERQYCSTICKFQIKTKEMEEGHPRSKRRYK